MTEQQELLRRLMRFAFGSGLGLGGLLGAAIAGVVCKVWR